MCKVFLENSEERFAPLEAELRAFCKTSAEIDAFCGEKIAESIEIGGLNQKNFDYFVKSYGGRYKRIYFFKCPRVRDLSALSTLENVEFLKFYWNNTAETLWDMRANASLERVELLQFTKLGNLDGAQYAPKLCYLSLHAYSDKVLDVSALAESSVRVLDITARLKTVSVKHFKAMQNLEALFLHPNVLPTEAYAWLSANLQGVRSETLYPYVKMKYADCPDVIICGKGKPSLYSDKNAKKISEYKHKFYELVEKYAGMEYCEAFPNEED